MTLINLSSSDSDWGPDANCGSDDNSEVSTLSASKMILVPWPDTHGSTSNSKEYDDSLNMSLKRKSAFYERPSILGRRSQNIERMGDTSNFVDLENHDEAHKKLNVSGNNAGNAFSQDAPKRILPSSLNPSISRVKLNRVVESVGNNQNHKYQGKYSNPAGASLVNDQRFQKDNFGRCSGGEMIAIDNTGSRILPQSLLHGKSASHSQVIGHGDPVMYSGTSEERVAEHDERLVLQAALQDFNQPKHEATLPDGLLSVSLFRHQRIALHWMLQKENRSPQCRGGILADDQGLGKTVSMISLILIQRPLQSKFKEEDKSSRKTEALNLDDDGDNGTCNDVKVMPEVGTSLLSFHRQRLAAGTLVVCPATVLRQWFRELNEKVSGSKLSVLIYHGGNRTKDPVELAKYDVVLTTYSIIANEVPKQILGAGDDTDQRDGEDYGLSPVISVNKKQKKKPTGGKMGKNCRKKTDASSLDTQSGTLAKVIWFRVILDEAQTIKNHRTLNARACWGLRAKSRWCLSGTPIQNSIDDLYSYFRFLRMDPYCAYKKFFAGIKQPISRNATNGYLKLNQILNIIMLRRTKDSKIDGTPIVDLPPKILNLSKINFSTKERTFYSELEAESRKKFKAYAAAGTVKQNYANILLMLLRLRQACDHPLLVKGFNFGSVRNASTEMAKSLPKDFLVNLLSRLEDNRAICCVCSDPPEDSVVTFCGHVFCYQCISEHLTGEGKTCPVSKCTEQLGLDLVFSESTLKSCIYDDFSSSSNSSKSLNLDNTNVSSKIKAAIEIVRSHCGAGNWSTNCNGNSSSESTVTESYISGNSDSQTEGAKKAIIFSQWTTMLDLIEFSLKEECIPFRRLDGTMSLVSRDKAVKDFNSDPQVTVMLMSLKAGNLGLNMVAASLVILMDLWWNPTTEDQAIDRAHRIGQTRTVTVLRLTIKDSVEDRILSLQDEKRKVVASAFGDDQSGGSRSSLTVDDLFKLFMG